jgi:hypothetical protein
MRMPEEHLHLFDTESGTALRHPQAEAEDLTPVIE